MSLMDCSLEHFAIAIQLINYNKQLSTRLKTVVATFLNRESEEQTNAALKSAATIYNSLLDWKSTSCTTAVNGLRRSITEKCIDLDYIHKQNEEVFVASTTSSQDVGKPRKIFADGVFDLAHFGHFNALRQAHELGDELHVGVTADDEVFKAKGVYPIYTCEERARIISGCKWVTSVIPGTPYDISMEFFKSTGCDYVAHGDDFAPNAEGIDCYQEVRCAGLLKVFKRTSGISTTTLASRLLGVMTSIPISEVISVPTPATTLAVENTRMMQPPDFTFEGFDDRVLSNDDDELEMCPKKQNLLSSKRILQFMGQSKKSHSNASRVVYVDGSFDILHCGHVNLFKRAKALGDFLIVGVYAAKGPPYPVQTLLERSLNLMAMRDVDEVIIGVPVILTPFLLNSFNISVVVRGKVSDFGIPWKDSAYGEELLQKGILQEIESESVEIETILVSKVGRQDQRLINCSIVDVSERLFFETINSMCFEIFSSTF